MRLAFGIVMLGLLAGCAGSGQPRGTSRDGRVVTSAFTRLDLGDAVYHCRHPSSSKPYPLCHQPPIPVVVLLRDNPINGIDCVTLMPYNELRIHTNGKKKTDVKWELLAPDGHEFIDTGVAIRKESSPNDVVDVYEGNVNGGKTITWTVRENAPFSNFKHDATVRKISGNIKCDPIDPVISNTD